VPVKSALFFALMRHVWLAMVATGIIENRRGSLMFICKLLNHDSFLFGLEDESTHA
jgi:hypothetical protein